MNRCWIRTIGWTGVVAGTAMAAASAWGAPRAPVAMPFFDEQAFINAVKPGELPGGVAGFFGTGLEGGADHVESLQCANGGWGFLESAGCGTTFHNITAPIAMGLLHAYSSLGHTTYRDAAVAGGAYDMTGVGATFPVGGGVRFGSFTPAFFQRLSVATGDATYATSAATDYFDKLTAGTYGDAAGSTCASITYFPGDTYAWIARFQCIRSGGQTNLRPWDLHLLPWAAGAIGNPHSTTPADGVTQQTAFLNAVLDGLNTLDSISPGVNPAYFGDVLGLAGAVRGLALNGTTSFSAIVAPSHAAINGMTTLGQLADALAGMQNANGSWYWRSNSTPPPVAGDEDTQTTAYAVLALEAADPLVPSSYSTQVAKGRQWLRTMQRPSGAFISYPGSPVSEDNVEVDAEAVNALSGPIDATGGVGLVSLIPDKSCYKTGETVTINVRSTGATSALVGGQFFLEYDPGRLTFLSAAPGDAPFTLEVYQCSPTVAPAGCPAVPGLIDYAVGVPFGDPGTAADRTMAVITFTAVREVCVGLDLLVFRSHDPPTRLTASGGGPVDPGLSNLPTITIDGTPPTITFSPARTTIACTDSTAPVDTGGPATATDSCDSTPTISFTDVELPGGCPQEETINRTWRAEDDCGNFVTRLQAITVEDNVAPTISCPPNITVNSNAGLCTAAVNVLPANWTMGGDAELTTTGDPSNPYAVELSSIGAGFSFMSYAVPGVMTFNGLATLSSAYNMTTGCFGGGSPRFQLRMDMDNDGLISAGDKNVFVYFGTPPSFNDCPVGWQNTGNVIASVATIYDTTQVGGAFYDTHTGAAVLVGVKQVLRISIVMDAGWMGPQVGLFDNVNINGSLSNFGNASASDNCDPSPVITAVRSDSQPLTAPFPSGTTRIVWTATDACGNSSSCNQTVTVSGLSELVVSVRLAGSGFPATLTRCITFELWDCIGAVPDQIVSQTLTFNSGLASNATVLVPCGAYTCITARDELHTLRRTANSLSIVGTQYNADFTGGDSLVGGNLNDDFFIDILDFGVFAGEFGPPNYLSADTTCLPVFPHADVSGDGFVTSADFSFIQINFLKSHEANCCGAALATWPDAEPQPVRRISMRQLHALGLDKLAAGDLNHDGWLDELDMAAFAAGAHP